MTGERPLIGYETDIRAESASRLATSVCSYIHILKLVKRSLSETEDFTT